eukprot:4653881-Amphidinium_carterae.1
MSMPLPACKPMKARNKPIPAMVAFIIHVGKNLKTNRLASVADITMKMMPSMNTANMTFFTGLEVPLKPTMVYAK